MAAVCARYQNRHDDAFDRLAELKAASPDYGRAWQEEGHLRRKLGDNAGALTAFERATRYNPSLIASWKAMAELQATAGQSGAPTMRSPRRNGCSPSARTAGGDKSHP
jgi:tetratricopeptide (TPR) repeat protein